MKRKLISALKDALFDYHYSFISKKAVNIINLCGYYGFDEMSDALQLELEKLQIQLPQLVTLDKLLECLEKKNSREFRVDSFFHRHQEEMSEQLTFNPTFHVQIGDESSLIAEIGEIRRQLNQPRINMAPLISHIGKMARQAGDLNFEEEV